MAAVGLLAMGCGQKAEPSRPPLRGEVGPNVPNLYAANAGQGSQNWSDPSNTASGPVYRGLTVEQWVEQVQTPDSAGHQPAVLALAQLGPPGYAKLIEVAQHHRSPETRVLALQAIQQPQLVEHDKETVPMLIRMLQDPSPLIRQAAALRLAWFDRTASGGSTLERGYQVAERMRALDFASRDPNPYVRETARDSLMAVQAAMKGTVASD